MDDELRPLNRGNGDQIDLIEFLIVLAKHKGLIIGMTVAAAVFAASISLCMPPYYLARTKFFVLSPSQVLAQAGGAVTIADAGKPMNDVYAELIKSRPLLDRIIDRFGLMKIYGYKRRNEARSALQNHIMVQYGAKSNVITLEVEDRAPKRAAAMANAFIEELRNMNNSEGFTRAAPRSHFFAEQVKEAKESLVNAQAAMKDFQEKNGAVLVDDQVLEMIESIAHLRAQVAAKELQLKVMRTYMHPENPEFLAMEEELKNALAQAERLEAEGTRLPVMIPPGTPALKSMEYVRLLREVKFNEALVELLQEQYQSSKIEALQNTFTIQVIEQAEAPAKKDRPRRTLMVVVGTIIGFLCAILTTFFLEYKEKLLTDPARRARWETLKGYLRFSHMV